ncbi:aspartate/glutamate racemase family protein [Stappia sp.]|jgi:allantoin racemase|uniref:aspartate/glutamate racemase family protein n=1 Tax=Stappia sp. TaxID=1870903 RepID=UPI003A9A405C
MTRILVLVPQDLELSAETDAARAAADAATEIVVRGVPLVSTPPVGAHDWALADLAVMAAGQDAEAEGFDAVALADFGDYGAPALRSLLSIPVAPAGRCSMLHAMSLSGRFSVLATSRDFNRAGRLVHDYGLLGNCSGVFEVSSAEDIAMRAASSDAVVLAGTAATLASGAAHVPLVRPLPVAVKLAESLVGLGLTHSRRAYPEPEMRKPDLIRKIGGA